MRIAIIGSGIAGLTATWRLGPEHHVELFEARPALGMDSASVDVSTGHGTARIDVPLRVFGSGYYPNLVRLYEEAGIPRGGADYSASYSELGGRTYFAYRSLVREGRAVSLPDLRLGGRRENVRRVYHGARLYLLEPRRLAEGRVPEVRIDEYLAARGYPEVFTEDILWPTLAAILTCSMSQARAHPARAVIDFFGRVFGKSFDRVATGTRTVVRTLSRPAARVHLDTPVRAVRRAGDAVELTTAGGVARFDHVVFATQVHLLGALLADSRDDEREVFEAFAHTGFECVVHDDPALMPADRAGWRPINALVGPRDDMPMFTMWMNRIVPDLRDAPPIFQTINPLVRPAPERVKKSVRLDRPLLSLQTVRAARRLEALHDERGRRVWFCGSYATEGFPLLEAAVVSASRVAERLRARTST